MSLTCLPLAEWAIVATQSVAVAKKCCQIACFRTPPNQKRASVRWFSLHFFFSTFQKLCRPVPIYFVRILSCLNCSSFWFSKNELIFNRFFFLLFHFNFSCFTHNCFLLTVWPKRFYFNHFRMFFLFFFRIENFEFCRVSHFCVVLFFFPVSRWFSFWKISDSHWFSLLSRVSVKPNW